MTETIPIKKQNGLPPGSVCASHKDKGYLTIKDWLREFRHEGDPHEPIVKAFRAARKAAEASLAA